MRVRAIVAEATGSSVSMRPKCGTEPSHQKGKGARQYAQSLPSPAATNRLMVSEPPYVSRPPEQVNILLAVRTANLSELYEQDMKLTYGRREVDPVEWPRPSHVVLFIRTSVQALSMTEGSMFDDLAERWEREYGVNVMWARLVGRRRDRERTPQRRAPSGDSPQHRA
jgi:hypothetical protein